MPEKTQLTRVTSNEEITADQLNLIDQATNRGYQWPEEAELTALNFNALLEWLVEHYPDEFELA